ncbi:MAG: tRNA (adenosine(37)-N6)-threonylcarbamoyltransferase complex ATPase subunit type 1 TsaE [Bacteroidales bacterium]|nr:tRNA (adenosine(37)-N6)-threonylcarbamoyltransferase complex ATPase subunit type 1 TsaE [Bacteroidales bacterium]
MQTFEINGIQSLEAVARQFWSAISEHRVIAFYGSMGAGKTTFITALCKVLGVEDTVNSPTFTLVNEYEAADGMPVWHFDFYRIERPEEALDIGLEEYLYGDGLCLIEWPENIEPLLPEDCLKVYLEVVGADQRRLSFELP